MEGFMGQNVVSSKEGKVFVVRNSQNFVLSRATGLDTSINFNKVDVRMLGRRVVGKKIISWNGDGTLSLYQSTSELKSWALDYVNNGIMPYFNVQSWVHDPSTSLGTESIVYSGCLFDDMTMTALATDDGVLEDELSFTYEDIELLEKFTQRIQGEL